MYFSTYVFKCRKSPLINNEEPVCLKKGSTLIAFNPLMHNFPKLLDTL